MAIGIRFPFQESFEGGVFRYTKTTPEQVRTNLIALLTLRRKQRPMRNNLFSPLYDVIFEPWDEITSESLRTAILEKLEMFMPEITVQDVVFTFDEDTHVLTTKVVYSIIELAGINDYVEINVTIQGEI